VVAVAGRMALYSLNLQRNHTADMTFHTPANDTQSNSEKLVV